MEYQSPLAGGPRTIQTKDAKSLPVFTIKAQALTPVRAKVVDAICDFLRVVMWLTAAAMVVMMYAKGRLTVEAVVALALGLVGVYFSARHVLRVVFRKRTVIRMTVDAISVRGLLGWKHFKRDVRRSFVVLSHDLVQWELEANDLKRRKAAQKGHVIQPRKYYGYSGHVVLVYAGQRVDLAEVFDIRRATPIVARLQYCDEQLDTALGKTRGPDEGRGWAAPEPGAV